MDSVREGEGGKIWENGIETCKISCMKQTKKKRMNVWDPKREKIQKAQKRSEQPKG